MQHANPCLALWLAAALWGLGCSDPVQVLEDSRTAAGAGDTEEEERLLRRGLEAHPDNLPLLLAAAEFYLRAEPEERYKPRLALHYAMRADQAARQTSPEAARLLHRAHRAAGGFPEAEALLEKGLAAINHPDAGNPRLFEPVDPDLLEPTLANLLEQNRRRAGAHLPLCTEGLVLIPGGLYPVTTQNSPNSTTDIRVDPFCAEALPWTDPPQTVPKLDEAGRLCAARKRRNCTTAEHQVLCGPLKAALRKHPTCGDRHYLRCCAPPIEPEESPR